MYTLNSDWNLDFNKWCTCVLPAVIILWVVNVAQWSWPVLHSLSRECYITGRQLKHCWIFRFHFIKITDWLLGTFHFPGTGIKLCSNTGEFFSSFCVEHTRVTFKIIQREGRAVLSVSSWGRLMRWPSLIQMFQPPLTFCWWFSQSRKHLQA